MKVNYQLRTNHTDLLSDGTYSEYWNNTLFEANKLNTLLCNIDGTITIQYSDNSWLSHIITIDYKGYTFVAKKTYKGIFSAHDVDMYALRRKIPHSTEYTVPKLKNFTFDKLTTKKVLAVLDYEVAYYEWIKLTVDGQKTKNQARYCEGLNLLEKIARAINSPIKTSEDDMSITNSVYTPVGTAIVMYNKQSEYVDINYTTMNIIKLLDMMKPL